MNDARIGAGQPADESVGAVNECGKGARDQPDMKKIQLAGTSFFAAQEKRRQRGRKRKRVERRDGDGERDRERELAIENARGAGEERNRHKHGNQHQRSGDHRAGHLAHGARSGLTRFGVFHVNVALHILDDHNRVVDHQARGQRDAEERERIDGEIEDPDKRKGADERNRNGDGGNDGGAPIEQEQKDDRDDDNDGCGQRDEHFANRFAHSRRGVEGDCVFKAGRKALRELLQRGLGLAVHVEGVGV